MEPFQSKRNVQTGIMRLAASPRTVFPLLCPKREYDWIPEWQCRMIFSETGAAENNAVFYTDFRPDRGPEWWTVHLAADGPDGTIATWTQTLTALGPEGNAAIDRYGDSSYSQEIEMLAKRLDHYLRTGTRLETPGHAGE